MITSSELFLAEREQQAHYERIEQQQQYINRLQYLELDKGNVPTVLPEHYIQLTNQLS